MLKVAVFASGGGTNLQALIDARKRGLLKADIAAVISNNSAAFALERARIASIAAYHISQKAYPNSAEFFSALVKVFKNHAVDLIVLAGYMKLLPSPIVEKYRARIINIHPALLPKFGGPGMYGLNVHKAVLTAGEKQSGASVHFVDERFDNGQILIQRRVPVNSSDTPETLAARVLEIEHQILPLAVSLFVK